MAAAAGHEQLRRLRAILLAQLKHARRLLAAQRMGSDRSIHEARKRVKRARAIVRLLRDAVGENAYRRINLALRDVNRRLRGPRDTTVLRQTLRSIGRRQPQLRRFGALLEQSWRQQPAAAAGRRLPGGAVQSASARLARIERVMGQAMRRSHARPSAQAAMRDTYRKARAAFNLAQRRSCDSAWHECRKQSKYLQYQLQLTGVHASAHAVARARALAALLGEDHDLALLRGKLSGTHGAAARAPRCALLSYIDHRRARLQHKAITTGSRLFRHRARAFADRLRPAASHGS